MKQKVESSKAPKCLVLAVITITLALTGCAPFAERPEAEVTVTLPPIGGESVRAIAESEVARLQAATASYRVKANQFTRIGTAMSYKFFFSPGTKVDVTVECLDSSGQVIVRSVTKSIVIKIGVENNVSFVLREDGTEIVLDFSPPASGDTETGEGGNEQKPDDAGDDGGNGQEPDNEEKPKTGKVTYIWGDANIHGTKNGLPTDENSYVVGETFTVDSGSNMTWEHATSFAGWKATPPVEPEAGGQATADVQAGSKYKMHPDGVVLTAQWTAREYGITYSTAISGGGSGTQASSGADTFTMGSGSGDAALSKTSDSGGVYNFAGWATSSNAASADINGTADIRRAVASGALTIAQGSVTLHAVWTNLPTYTVTFDDSQLRNMEYWQGNQANNTVTVIQGQSVSAQQVRSFLDGGKKQNYTLTYSGDGSGAITSAQNFEIDASKVSFDTTYTVKVDLSALQGQPWWNGSDTSFTRSVRKDGQLLASDIQTEINNRKKQNYKVTYKGGDKQISSINNINVTISTGDVEVVELFTVTYDWGNGITPTSGDLPDTQTVESGAQATVTIPTGVTREGYNFLGWHTQQNQTSNPEYATGGNLTIQNVTSDIKLYAVWQLKTYTLTYSAGTDSAGTAITASDIPTQGSFQHNVPKAISSDKPTRSGYKFLGWADADKSTSADYEPGKEITLTADKTIYAVWQQLYTITYNIGSGPQQSAVQDFKASDSVPAGNSVTLPTLTAQGYDFGGWLIDGATKTGSYTPTASVTATAQWTANINGQTIKTTQLTLNGKDINIVLTGVQGGEFTMGDNSDSYNDNDEWDGVTVSSFYMSKTEVTQAQFEEVLYGKPSFMADSDGNADNNPITSINWYAAIAFCNALSVKEGKTPCYSVKGVSSWGSIRYSSIPNATNDDWDAVTCNWDANGYRLPTEAEWEYAARGGSNKSPYTYSGSDDADEVAWHSGNSDKKTHEVGTTPKANALGIYDMSGNAYEWCWDWYDANGYESANTQPDGSVKKSDPTGAAPGSNKRVFRSSNFENSAISVSIRGSGFNPPVQLKGIGGLRIVCRQ